MTHKLSRQRGVAVVTALLLTTLAITIVASLFWQQQVQVRSMENQRLQLQTKWILRGALDWAALILREDRQFADYDHYGEPWAVKLAETRLDDYVERDRNDGDESDASLSGYIIDAQARYNLNNLAKDGAPVPAERDAFARLLENLSLRRELADVLAQAIAASQQRPQTDQQPAPARAGQPLRLLQVEDLLAVPGFTLETVEALREYVVFLPGATTVNVNTASAPVLAAVTGLSLAEAQAQVTRRDRAFFRTTADFSTSIGKQLSQDRANAIGVGTSFFFVYGRVRLDRASLQTLALLERPGAIGRITQVRQVWVREL